MKSILFDLDGTLVDSSIGIKAAFHYAFTKLQLPLPTDKELSTFIGPPLETTFGNYFSNKKDIDKAIKSFRFYYNDKGVHQVKLYPEIVNLLDELTDAGYNLFVTTSKNQPMAVLMLTELGISNYFKAIYGALPNRFHKADVITACLTEQYLIQTDAIIIGDTKFDIIGGQAAKIKTLGITWGFGKEDDLRTAGADSICHTPSDIEKVLKSL